VEESRARTQGEKQPSTMPEKKKTGAKENQLKDRHGEYIPAPEKRKFKGTNGELTRGGGSKEKGELCLLWTDMGMPAKIGKHQGRREKLVRL